MISLNKLNLNFVKNNFVKFEDHNISDLKEKSKKF